MNRPVLLGAQTSIAGGVHNALIRGEKLGCLTIQMFTKSSTRWKSRVYKPEEVAAFHRNRRRTGIAPVIAHDSYLINLASPDQTLYGKSIEALWDELNRCHALKIPYLVIHPGSHRGSGVLAGLERIASAIDIIHARDGELSSQLVFETTAGQGTSLGFTFQQLATLLELIHCRHRVGICLDTCHIFAAGYELRTEAGYRETMAEFDAIVGRDKLKVIHVNDSKNERGSRIDRHQHIGRGFIGLSAFELLVNDPTLEAIPKIIETPRESGAMDRINLNTLRELASAGKAPLSQGK